MIKKTTDIVTTRLAISMILLVIFGISTAGGQYEISWSTVNGGGASGGGGYELTAAIGQPEAGSAGGGDYELLGGFLPGGPLCFVEFEDFARFADYWLQSGSGLPADLHEDGTVDWLDVALLVDEWLSSCPYNWPLK
ncbi:MAG: hypothetical protein ACYTEQ_07710 [Planctomycetota bacterium]|jgi:hypothetical protein